MKVFITGGNGFLGKHIQKEFANHPDVEIYCPSSKNCNILSMYSFSAELDVFKPNAILHMAAQCGGILANRNSPADFISNNLQMGINVFELARIHNIKYVYTLGSVCAYPCHCPVPFKEDDLWNGRPEPTNEPYGHAKRTLLIMQGAYKQQYNIGGAHLIPVNMYAEYDHFDLTNSHVIPALIRKFIEAKETNVPNVICWGTGNATREFLYAGDAAKAIVKAVINKLDTELPINIGTGKDISIKDLAQLIASLVGYTGNIVFDSSYPDGQPKRMLDVSRAKLMLNWKAETDLKDGLIKTIEWYKNNRI